MLFVLKKNKYKKNVKKKQNKTKKRITNKQKNKHLKKKASGFRPCFFLFFFHIKFS